MKTLIAAAAMSLVAGAAFAAEGNGDPFAYHATVQPVQTAPLAFRGTPASQNPYPFTVPMSGFNTVPLLPTNGSQGIVQTANSLPAGAAEGTTSYAAGPQVTAVQLAHAAPARPGTHS